jgi:NADH-quinone oxidoreductase subunit J
MVLNFFYFLSFLAILSGIMVVVSKNPIHSVLYLILTFFTLSGHYILLNAQFISIVNLIVYAGAIMVLFLFTIMLMNLNKEDEVHKPRMTRYAAVIIFILLCGVLTYVFVDTKPIMGEYDVTGQDFQSIKVLGKVLLNEYMVPFEFVSILLLTAMLGVVLLSKKEKSTR